MSRDVDDIYKRISTSTKLYTQMTDHQYGPLSKYNHARHEQHRRQYRIPQDKAPYTSHGIVCGLDKPYER